jgi:hypothetical protein
MTQNKKTVIIHNVTASNDVTDDCNWVDIMIVVALDHDNFEVVGADVSEVDLIEKMKAWGYHVLFEDDEFIYENRWVRKKASDDILDRLQETNYEPVCVDAFDEIVRLRALTLSLQRQLLDAEIRNVSKRAGND